MRIFQDINGLVELFNSYEYTANLAYELEVYANDITIIDIHDRNDVVRADSLKSDDTGGNMHASDRSPETKTNSQPPMHGGLLSRSKKKSLTSTIASAFDGILKRETGLERNRNSKL